MNLNEMREKIINASSLKEAQELAAWLLGYASAVYEAAAKFANENEVEDENESEDWKSPPDEEPSDVGFHRTRTRPPPPWRTSKRKRLRRK